MSDPILTVSSLCGGYEKKTLFGKQGRPVLRDVSFTVGRGEIVGLVGESGTGKSTLAKMILGVVMPASGSVSLAGQARMVFQNPGASLNPSFTVRRILEEPLRVARVPRAELAPRVEEIAAQCGLEKSLLAVRPGTLSGGQQQRVAIAAALITRPALVVADEPVSALDVTVAAGILELIRRLRTETGTAFLFISHDLNVIASLCDRVLVMKDGALVEQGDVKTVFTFPSHPYTRRLLDSVL